MSAVSAGLSPRPARCTGAQRLRGCRRLPEPHRLGPLADARRDRSPDPCSSCCSASGIFLTWRLRFVQVVRLPAALRLAFSAGRASGGGVLTPFQAFATALAASIGTGNIAGVATAVVSGGPGAVFWIWCYGLLAAATKFTEAVLGITFRHAEARPLTAGPPYILRDGLEHAPIWPGPTPSSPASRRWSPPRSRSPIRSRSSFRASFTFPAGPPASSSLFSCGW